MTIIEWKRLKEAKNYCNYCRTPSDSTHIQEWIYFWHSLIDHLANGETAESFFKELKVKD